jgi:hypothetical protein
MVALAVSACGGSDAGSGASAGSASTQPARGPGAALRDPKVQACLKKQGVTLPQGGGAGPQNGYPPANGYGGGTSGGGGGGAPNGGPPPTMNGQAPRGGGQGDRMQFEKLRKALAACGVQGFGRGQRPPAQTTTGATTNS